jgi:ElaB/YqjD/DUF883 family membrane-anchored ribosome-binding protein
MSKDSAQLEREIEAQRDRVETRIGEIRDRLSPGQLVDEIMSYTKTNGGQFAANLGGTISANPLPATLLGVSLVWLMSGQGAKQASHTAESDSTSPEYPYATVQGSMRRVQHAADTDGEWYSHFEDAGGKRYRAKSNEVGHRVGEFMDDSGRAFGGFIDETGHRVRDFRDEIGNRFDDATGWASHRLHDMKHTLSDAADYVATKAHNQTDRTVRYVGDAYMNQPLVAGALAFAAGAALAAALPHTKIEDDLVGDAADKLRSDATAVAADAYAEGKEAAGDLYERGKDAAKEVLGGESETDSPRSTDFN